SPIPRCSPSARKPRVPQAPAKRGIRWLSLRPLRLPHFPWWLNVRSSSLPFAEPSHEGGRVWLTKGVADIGFARARSENDQAARLGPSPDFGWAGSRSLAGFGALTRRGICRLPCASR